MIDVNQLTQQLRLMPDQALQQIAMMYKDDPYILPMVISEDTARKKLRMAAQAQAAQPQGTVKDQAIMSMGMGEEPQAPDEAGIAALQAPNMENMADGGIAGEPEMSEFDFAQRSEPVVRMAEGGVPRYQVGGTLSISPEERYRIEQKEMDEGRRTDYSPETKAYFRQIEDAQMAANRALGERMRAQEQAGGRAAYQASGIAATPARPAEPAKPAAPAVAAGSGRGTSPGGPMPGEQITYPALRKEAPSERKKENLKEEASEARGAPSGAPSGGGIESLVNRLFEPTERDFRRRMGLLQLNAERRRDEEQMAFEAGKPKGQIDERLEESLKKEEAGEAKEKEQAKALAIFNAGLAMMAGGSPRALENIAKGAMVGSGQYSEALKDLKKAAKERQKMLSDIDRARRAEARDDNKTALSLLQRANDSEAKLEGHMVDFGANLGLKKAGVYGELYGKQMDISARAAAARLPAAEVQLVERVAKERNIPFFEAYQLVTSARAEPRSDAQLRQRYADSAVLRMQYPTVDQYLNAMRSQGTIGGQATDSSGFKYLGARNP